MTLATLKVGDRGTIASIEHDADGHWRKLAAFGLLPGEQVHLIQRWPAYIVRVGHTEVGLDEQTARLVRLKDGP